MENSMTNEENLIENSQSYSIKQESVKPTFKKTLFLSLYSTVTFIVL